MDAEDCEEITHETEPKSSKAFSLSLRLEHRLSDQEPQSSAAAEIVVDASINEQLRQVLFPRTKSRLVSSQREQTVLFPEAD